MCVFWNFSTEVKFGRKIFFSVIFLVFLSNFSFNSAFSAYAASSAGSTASTPPIDLRIFYVPNVGLSQGECDAKLYLDELFKILSRYENFKVTLVPASLTVTSALEGLQSKDANMVAFFAKSPERMFRYKFSKYPIATTPLYLVADAKKDINFSDVHAMNGKTVSIFVENSVAKNALDTFIVKNNIQMKYLIYDNYHEYTVSPADYHLVNGFYFMQDKQVAANIGKQEMHFATLPEHQSLLDKLDMALEKAFVNDAIALKKLYLEHVDRSTFAVRHGLTAAEQKMIDNPSKVAEVGFASDTAPLEYVNEKGEPDGIAIGVLWLLQQMHQNPTRLIPYASDGKTDISKFDMTFSVVGDREVKEKYFYTSKPYATIPFAFFMRKKPLAAEGERIFAFLDYSTVDLQQVQKQFPQWKMQIASQTAHAIQAFEEGKVDAILLSGGGAEGLISRFGVDDNIVIPTSLVLPLQFYLHKKYPPEALNVLNAFLDKLDPLAVQRIIMEETNELRAPNDVEGFLLKHKNILIVLTLLGLGLFLGGHWLRSRSERRRLYKLLNTDDLTGLSTQNHAYRIMEKVLRQAKPGEYMVLSCDIDRFSLLNQVYGKDKGDEVLRFGAGMLLAKYSGNNKAECIARLRDDVFLIFLKTRTMDSTIDTPEYLLDGSDGVKEILRSNYTISISRGYYIIEDPTLCPETIVDYANAARRHGKSEHGFTTIFFDEQMRKEMEAQKQVIYRMEHAIANDEFLLHFQPKVDLKKNKLCGAEVLVRWQMQDGEPIYPDAFISVFESNAFIAKLDMYVFEKVCQFISAHRNICVLPPCALNLSGISILHDETYTKIRKFMSIYGIDASEVEIEITESALVAESDTFLTSVRKLNELGFNIAIDDFGTGVSSLHRLSSLEVDVVKLDKAFLDDKLTQRKGILLVASLISMLHRLNIKVVAEGVESARHVEILKKMHCDVAQGYYFAKPLPEEVFVQKLLAASSAMRNCVPAMEPENGLKL